jgi:hypothetical protein
MPTAIFDPEKTTASSSDVSLGPSDVSGLPLIGDYTLIQGGWLPRDQEYYWTEDWQVAEQETLQALAAGEGIEFDSTEDLIHWLFSTDEN